MTLKKTAIPVEYWEGVAAVDKLSKRKMCLASSEECNGSIIQAHTIPRSQLDRIAEDGHVSAFQYHGNDLAKNDGQLTVGKRGISQFSVLNCFCKKHDLELFSHVENDELVFDQHQLTLLHYRALGAELYKKQATAESFKRHIDEFRGKKSPDAAAKLMFLELMLEGQNLGLRDIEVSFSQISKALLTEDYDSVSALIVSFEHKPSIMTVGAFAPESDYNGQTLQSLGEENSIVEHVSFSVLCSKERACAALIWLKGSEPGELLARSLVQQKQAQVTTLLIQTAFEYIENTCMNSAWWTSLREVERQVLVRRMQASGNASALRSARCLTFGGVSFDDWGVSGFEFKNVSAR